MHTTLGFFNPNSIVSIVLNISLYKSLKGVKLWVYIRTRGNENAFTKYCFETQFKRLTVY